MAAPRPIPRAAAEWYGLGPRPTTFRAARTPPRGGSFSLLREGSDTVAPRRARGLGGAAGRRSDGEIHREDNNYTNHVMYIYIYTYMCIYIYTHTYACICISLSLSLYLSLSIYIYIYIYILVLYLLECYDLRGDCLSHCGNIHTCFCGRHPHAEGTFLTPGLISTARNKHNKQNTYAHIHVNVAPCTC